MVPAESPRAKSLALERRGGWGGGEREEGRGREGTEGGHTLWCKFDLALEATPRTDRIQT